MLLCKIKAVSVNPGKSALTVSIRPQVVICGHLNCPTAPWPRFSFEFRVSVSIWGVLIECDAQYCVLRRIKLMREQVLIGALFSEKRRVAYVWIERSSDCRRPLLQTPKNHSANERDASHC